MATIQDNETNWENSTTLNEVKETLFALQEKIKNYDGIISKMKDEIAKLKVQQEEYEKLASRTDRRNIVNHEKFSNAITKMKNEIARLKVQQEEYEKLASRTDRRNIVNHEKFSNAITEIRRKINRIYPFALEEIADQEYEYNRSLPSEKYKQELIDWFERRTGQKLNLNDPKTLNEKINWMKLYDSSDIKTRLADKYMVRKWAAAKIGEQYLVPLLGVWNNFDDVNFDILPNQFVLKCNHGSGMNIIVDNKDAFDISAARRKIKKWLNTNYAYTQGLELHYKKIKPLIIAEKYLADNTELKDFKFLCFHGEPRYVWVDYDRYTNHTRDVFDLEWNLQPFTIKYPNSKNTCQRPESLKKMTEMAKKLSEGFPFVRVDMYNVNGNVYFGEMTFTSDNGIGNIYPKKYDRILGDLI